MKRLIIAIIFIFGGVSSVIGQSMLDKLGVGFNIGGQKIYGDILGTGFGIGLEAYAKYSVNERFFVTTALGYGELSDGTFGLDKSHFTTDLFNFDVKGAVNLMTDSKLSPYVFLGLGVFNFKNELFNERYFDGSFILGGGMEYAVSPMVGINSYADYRFTTGDDLDNIRGGVNDGYLNVRGGVTYYFNAQSGVSQPKVIADADRLPLDEFENLYDETESSEDDELAALIEGIDSYEEASSADFTMEEYIKLKSRVDQLNDAIRQKELEIEELKAQLESRKERVASLEDRMRNRGGALASSLNMNLSDFSTSYEQGLENFYAREYDASIYAFNMLLEGYPNHRLASNCRYWIGECYFGKGNYDSAIESFNMVFDYGRSVKKDDALLMMGRSYMKLGNYGMAKQMFDRLMNEYPDSEYFYKAENYANQFSSY